MPRKAKRRRVYGSGTVFQRGGRWWIQWRENGKRRGKSFVSEELARKVLAKILQDITLGQAGIAPDRTAAPTLAELAQPWLKRREKTHRSWEDDKSRWNLHLAPVLGNLRPTEVDSGKLRLFIETKLAEGLAASTVGNCIRLLSTFYADIIEGGHATSNPVSALPRATRKLYRSAYDTRGTAFLESMEAVRKVYLALPSPIDVAFACGVFLGLRTGECLGLRWQDIDFQTRRVRITQQVQGGEVGPLKDSEPRTVPLMDSLVPILQAYRLATGGEGMLFKPSSTGGRPDIGRPPQYMRPETLRKHLAVALTACGLPGMTWYSCTRHTFASLFVLGGGSLELLRQLMGHSSVVTTERYSHLRPDLYRADVFKFMAVDLTRPEGKLVQIPASMSSLATSPADEDAKGKVTA